MKVIGRWRVTGTVRGAYSSTSRAILGVWETPIGAGVALGPKASWMNGSGTEQCLEQNPAEDMADIRGRIRITGLEVSAALQTLTTILGE